MTCNRRVLGWLLIVCLVGLTAAPAVAGPPMGLDQVPAPLKEKLNTVLDVRLIETPFERALEQLYRDAGGATVVVDREALAVRITRPVTIEAAEMTFARALDWVTRSVGGDWDVRDGVIFISSPDEIVRPYLSLQVYDVRELTMVKPRFDGAPSLALTDALSNTSSGGGGGAEGVAQSAGSLFGEQEAEDATASIDEVGQDIVQVITGGVPDGRWNTLKEVNVRLSANGLLLVTHTPAVQAQVRELLTRYQQASGKMVAMEARFVLMPQSAVDALLEGNDGSPIFDQAKATALMKTVRAAVDDAAKQAAGEQNQVAARSLGLARLTCFNNQRVYLTALRTDSFLSDVEPVPDTGGIDPTISLMHAGAVADLQPTVSFDDAHVTVVTRGQIALSSHLERWANVFDRGEAPGVSIDGGGALRGDVAMTLKKPEKPGEAAKAEGKIKGYSATGGRLVQDPGRPAMETRLDLPAQELVTYRTAVRIPDGGAALLGGYSAQFDGQAPVDSEIVLIIRARVLK